MSDLRASRVRTLVAQGKCPVCGSGIVSGGGGVAYARNTYGCGAAFSTDANGEIIADLLCPGPSRVAARHLNTQAARQARAGAA
jgi:hypothetical protein